SNDVVSGYTPPTNDSVMTVVGAQFTVPTNARYARVIFYNWQTSTHSWLFVSAVSARRVTVGAQIAGNTITADKMVLNTITAASGVIADLAIATAKIQDGAITNAKIGNLQVDNAKIADGTIQSAKIYKLTADKIDVGNLQVSVTLTSGSIRTGSGNPRVELTSAGLKAYNSSGTPTVQ